MPPGKVRLAVQSFLKKYPGVDDIRVDVMKRAEDLPGVDDADRYNYSAAFEPGTNSLYLVANAFDTRAQLVSVLQEEYWSTRGWVSCHPPRSHR